MNKQQALIENKEEEEKPLWPNLILSCIIQYQPIKCLLD